MSGNSRMQPIDEAKLNAFLGKVVGDFGAALGAALVYIGQKLGLYKAMAGAGPLTPQQLAERAGCVERYVREWLINQAAGGYVEYDPETGTYTLPPEQALALVDENSHFYVGGGFYVIKAMLRAEPRITEAFRNGGGMLWGEHDPDLFVGTEKFFRPGYTAHLVAEWIPSMAGVEEKLKEGAVAADVGCGHGASTIIMAQQFPNSRFYGFDNHEPSVEQAREAASEAGVADRVTFGVADANGYAGGPYDLIAFFDCLHDMGDPAGAMRHAFERLADDGSVLLVEPMAGDSAEGNFNPIGRVFSGASVLCCTPNSMALKGAALGTVATEKALRDIATGAGFTDFRRVSETPFNRIFEARK